MASNGSGSAASPTTRTAARSAGWTGSREIPQASGSFGGGAFQAPGEWLPSIATVNRYGPGSSRTVPRNSWFLKSPPAGRVVPSSGTQTCFQERISVIQAPSANDRIERSYSPRKRTRNSVGRSTSRRTLRTSLSDRPNTRTRAPGSGPGSSAGFGAGR